MLFFLLLISLAFVASTLAAPSKHSGCDISGAKLDLPPGQTALVQPTTPLTYVVLGVGYQNYTCSSSSNYTSVGAVAEIYDISCLYGEPEFATIQDDVYSCWKGDEHAKPDNLHCDLRWKPVSLGQHYFISNTTSGGLSPVWDFRSSCKGGDASDAYVVGARVGGIPAPTGGNDVDWLQLKGIEGKLATDIYRVDTKGGKAPATCTPGSPDISVKYTTKYYLYGGTAH